MLTLLGVSTVPMFAQTKSALSTSAPTIFDACYVRGTGTVYRINAPGLRLVSCARTDFPMPWTDGAGAVRSGDAAGGDLNGTFPNPLVVGLRGRLIDATAPTDGQVLRFDAPSSTWMAATLSGGGGVTDHGALTGLTDDDHPQYLLTEGVRASTGGFAVAGTFGSGSIPTTGYGVRLMWYPGKAAFRVGAVVGDVWDDANVGSYSIGLGQDVRARGQNATALGSSTNATGTASTALGDGTTASGERSTAMGFISNASGDRSTALGAGTTASGTGSTALGWATLAGGDYATAMGYNTRAMSGFSIAMGSDVTASGGSSTAMGSTTRAIGTSSTAMGDRSVAEGLVSTAMGAATTASASFSTAIGYHTTASGDASTALGWTTSASGQVATAMGQQSVASGAASTAIGYATTASGDNAVAMGDNTTADGASSTAMGSRASTNGQAGAFVYGDWSTQTLLLAPAPNSFSVRASGGTIFYSNSGMTSGVTLAPGAGAWATVSDRNRKRDFQNVDGEVVLARISTMPVPSWSYLSQDSSVRHLGPTAQDFYAAFGLGESALTITTTDIDGVNLLAAQALERRTRDLRDQLAKRDREIAELRGQLAELLQRLERLESSRR